MSAKLGDTSFEINYLLRVVAIYSRHSHQSHPIYQMAGLAFSEGPCSAHFEPWSSPRMGTEDGGGWNEGL